MIAQRMVGGARMIRTGMDDSVVLGDIACAITENGATFEEVMTAIQEHAELQGLDTRQVPMTFRHRRDMQAQLWGGIGTGILVGAVLLSVAGWVPVVGFAVVCGFVFWRWMR